MNWLAHIFLSEQNIHYQLGNLLADPCKGRAFPGASAAFKQGMKMHMDIDAFTDSHPDFLMSKSRLNKKGHLKGVVIDLTYDVFLTQYWHEYGNIGLDKFLDGFYQEARLAMASYPKELSTFVEKLIQVDHLRNYRNLSDLELTFSRVDKRLSENVLKRESTSDYLPLIEENLPLLATDFKRFFPDLVQHVRAKSKVENLAHWQPGIR